MGELFIEVMWGQRHIFLESREGEPARELRLMLSGIFGESELKNCTFVRTSTGKFSMDESASFTWEPIDESRSFADNGIISIRSRPHDPMGDHAPKISSLSIPPPLPDSMRPPEERPDMN